MGVAGSSPEMTHYESAYRQSARRKPQSVILYYESEEIDPFSQRLSDQLGAELAADFQKQACDYNALDFLGGFLECVPKDTATIVACVDSLLVATDDDHLMGYRIKSFRDVFSLSAHALVRQRTD